MKKTMLRKTIKSWEDIEDKLSSLLVYKPKMKDIDGFFNKDFEWFIVNSAFFHRNGIPTTIINIADYFVSAMRDVYRYALKEDQFEILRMIDEAVKCQFRIFEAHCEVYCTKQDMKNQILNLLKEIREEYEDYKKKQLKNYDPHGK